MSYDHKNLNIDKALGLNTEELFDKAQTVIDKMPIDQQEVVSRRVEAIENNLSSKELATLVVLLTKIRGTKTSKSFFEDSEMVFSEVSKEDIPSEILEKITEIIKSKKDLKNGVYQIKLPTSKGGDQCNCLFCQTERKLAKLKATIPLSKGGDA